MMYVTPPAKCQLIHPYIAISTLWSFSNAHSSENKQQDESNERLASLKTKQKPATYSILTSTDCGATGWGAGILLAGV